MTSSNNRVCARAAAAAALAMALGVGESPAPAVASVPAGTPQFTDPLDIDNPWFPFVTGAVKVFGGRSGRNRTDVVDLYLPGTRDFAFGGGTVSCRIVQETEFEGGELTEVSTNYFAQSDDGAVWYFGETVDEFEDGEVVGHGGSWLVGGPATSDPEETMTVASPGLFMPGVPEVGDEFRPEDLPDGSVEIGTVRRTARRVRVPAGRFAGCVEVREHHLPDDEFETKWYAPGVGVIRAKGHREILVLEASTLAPQ